MERAWLSVKRMASERSVAAGGAPLSRKESVEEPRKAKEEEKKEEAGKEAKPESESEDEDQDEILEESPCGRWQKRREQVRRTAPMVVMETMAVVQVRQRDVPGIDAAYLAMDTETGNEVVWNEVQFSERKNFRLQEVRSSESFH